MEKTDLDNLLAADKCISTSHMANGATRLQPLMLNYGETAGAAAALAVRSARTPTQIGVGELQQCLLLNPEAAAAVVPDWNTAWHHPYWLERQCNLLRGAEAWLTRETTPINAGATTTLANPALLKAEGVVEPGPEQTYRFYRGNGDSIPIITLEPAVHPCLGRVSQPTRMLVEITYNA